MGNKSDEIKKVNACYEVEKQLVDDAISNCQNSNYPAAVTGAGFGDDMAHALSVINVLLLKVEELDNKIKLKEANND